MKAIGNTPVNMACDPQYVARIRYTASLDMDLLNKVTKAAYMYSTTYSILANVWNLGGEFLGLLGAFVVILGPLPLLSASTIHCSSWCRGGRHLIEEHADLLGDPAKVAEGGDVVPEQHVRLPDLPDARLQHRVDCMTCLLLRRLLTIALWGVSPAQKHTRCGLYCPVSLVFVHYKCVSWCC